MLMATIIHGIFSEISLPIQHDFCVFVPSDPFIKSVRKLDPRRISNSGAISKPGYWSLSDLEDAMGTSSVRKLSGMQKQVLSLYREFLRAARSKSAEDRQRIESVVSAEFHRNSKDVDRKNFIYIEYLLRRGKKQLDQLKSPDTVGLSSLNFQKSQT